jgi:hypothetical protein
MSTAEPMLVAHGRKARGDAPPKPKGANRGITCAFEFEARIYMYSKLH